MNKLKQLSIGKQVLCMFGMLCVILAAIGGLLFFSLQSIGRSSQEQLSYVVDESELVAAAAQNVELMQTVIFRHVLASESAELKLHEQTVHEIDQANADKFASYQKFVDTEEERRLFARVLQARKEYMERTEQLLVISRANRDAEAGEFAVSKQIPAYEKYQTKIKDMTRYVENEVRDVAATMNHRIARIRMVSNVFVFIAILIAIGTGFAVAGVARQLKEDNKTLQIEVTARKQTENALRESNEKFHQLAENITDVFWIRSPDMRKVHYISPAFEGIWGRSAESLCSNPQEWIDAVLPEDRARVEALFATLTGAAPSISVEYRIERPDGGIRWVHVRGFQVRNAADELVSLTGVVTDITERKRADEKLEEAHKQLLETSRRAGMAEVATSVLHNVGNVLNSVNVSATLLAEKSKKSRVSSLAKLVALMDEHAADLGGFITNDPKGRQLPGFLAQLSIHLAAEQATFLKEANQLRKNIEHIKDIVAMQQNYAKVSGVTETMRITDLVEDALRMNDAALTRHRVEVVREFTEVPPVTIDKHKVLQVLVNLIRNAKYACDESGRPDKQMTLRVARGDNRVRISISDNGVGIPAENMTRIFNHGFTTRKDGHGFGLHSGALAAKEMGGALVVHSDGPSRGAVFTLELPMDQESNPKLNAA